MSISSGTLSAAELLQLLDAPLLPMDFSEESRREEILETAEANATDASRSTGIVTPYTIMVSLLAELKEMRRISAQQMREQVQLSNLIEAQNNAMSSLLKAVRDQSDAIQSLARTLDRPRSMSREMPVPMSPARSSPLAQQARYIDGEKVSTGVGVIAAVIYQLMSVVFESHVAISYPDITNDFCIGYKDMRAVIDGVVKAANKDDNAINIPKVSDASSRRVLSYVTSEDPLVPTSCTASHFEDMSRECYSLMAVVESVRKCIVRCEGIVGPVQQAILSAVVYPYVTDGIVCIDTKTDFKVLVRRMRARHKSVSRLKPAKRNEYAVKVLSGMSPYQALAELE